MVFEQKFADLLHLIGFRLSAFGLKIDDFRHAVAEKDFVAALPGAPCEARPLKDEAQVLEIEVRVGADKQGRISAIQGRYVFDTGGIPGTPTTLLMQASAAPYQCPNLYLEGYDIVTNKLSA